MRRDGQPTTRERAIAVSNDDLRPIWTGADFRATVTALRAAAAPERDEVAPVIDIRTRKRIA